jgi:ankyrin repeat protein
VSQTPLLVAARNNHLGVVQLLLERDDVETNVTDGTACPLWWAAFRGHTATVQLLLKRQDIDPNPRNDGDRRTPLAAAAEQGHEAVVRLLIERDDVKPSFGDGTAVPCGGRRIMDARRP